MRKPSRIPFLGLALALALLASPLCVQAAPEPVATTWRMMKPSTGPPRPDRLQVRFLGVSTLMFDDGETQILIDGFFSRPAKSHVLKVEPDRDVILDALARTQATRLAAVLTAHAHIDHALDAADVAKETGAMLFGSPSVAMIAGGRDLPATRFHVIKDGDVLRFKRFTVTVFEAPHSPKAFFLGAIARPLRPPAWIGAWRMGEANFSFLIEHGGQSILVHPSAHYRPGLFKGRHADLVFLGIGTLGKRGPGFADEMWLHVIKPTDPKVVIPIHWDDFSLPLSKGLKNAPRLFDDVPEGLRRVADQAADGPEVIRFMALCDPVDLPVSTMLEATDPVQTDGDGSSQRPGESCPRRR